MTAAYPLQWPDHIERSKSREAGKFKTTLAGAIGNVEDSLRRFATDSGKKIEARRTELWHGTLVLVRATFRGFQALPAPSQPSGWREVFGKPRDWRAGKSDVEARYRELAKERHPDVAGEAGHRLMSELNAARAAALKEIGS